MKKFKRIIALVTVAMFLLSVAAPAAMAKTTDDAVNRLNALSIVQGYDDGSFKPEQNITRAEYAAIVVQALGLGKAAEYVKGNTKFKDVTASHWASGVINIAVNEKILAGYPDGTFKPDQNVSYNEAITMIVRMLGYADTMTNAVYPTSYVTKAAELKILDDMAVADFKAFATRGNVFILADNALDTPMWVLLETNNKGEKVYGETVDPLLTIKQKVTEEDEAVIVEAGAGISGVAKDAATVDGNDYKWGVVGKSTSDYVGVKAKIYWKADGTDDKIVAVAPVGKIVTGKVDSYTAGSSDKIKLFGVGEYSLVSDAVYVIDGVDQGQYTDAYMPSLKGETVTLSLNDSGKVESVVLKTSDDEDVVKSVNTTDKKIEFKKNAALDLKNIDDKNLEIVRNGKAATLADIKAGDVVNYFTNNNSYTIYASDATVKGKLDSAAASNTDSIKFVIGGKSYYSTKRGFTYSTDGGETTQSRIGGASLGTVGTELVGKEITAKLDAQGNVVNVVAGSAAGADANVFDAFVRQIYRDDATGDAVYKILVTKLDGTAAQYEIDNEDYSYTPFNGDSIAWFYDADKDSAAVATNGDVAPFMMAKLTLASNGKVEKLAEVDNGSDAITAVNKDQDYVDTASGSKFPDSGTKVFSIKKYGANDTNPNFVAEASVTSYATSENYINDEVTALSPVTAYFKDSKLKYVVVNSTTTAGSDLVAVIVTGKQVALGDAKWGITVLEPGQASKTYEVTDSVYDTQGEQANITTKAFYLVKFNSDKTKISSVQTTDDEYLNGVVSEVNELSTVYEIKLVGGATVVVSKDAKVFKKTDSGTAEGTINDITNGKIVDLYNLLNADKEFDATPGDTIYDGIYVE